MGLNAAQAPALGGVPDAEVDRFRQDLIQGLGRAQKALPPKWFYDAEGSKLFEEITRLPEYYPTRQEAALLRALASDFAERIGSKAVIVEFGSGASEKTRILLDALDHPAAYVPLDISPDALHQAAERIRSRYPDLEVVPIVGDFERLPALPDGLEGERRLGFFPGSTIGNLETEDAIKLLRAARRMLGAEALFLLGVDLVKDEETLVTAYDDAAGVTAAFNLNVLRRANRELGADFDIAAFAHQAVWNPQAESVEMHLKAIRPTSVQIAGQPFTFAEGETIHTESSRKFTPESLRALAVAAGWTLERLDQGPAPTVALALLRA